MEGTFAELSSSGAEKLRLCSRWLLNSLSWSDLILYLSLHPLQLALS